MIEIVCCLVTVVLLGVVGGDPSRRPIQKNASTGVVLSQDDVRISYETLGVGTPSLLFIHGGLANRGVWREQDVLAERYRVVKLDLAGHGRSGSSRRTWSLESLANDVRAVAEALDLSSVVLVGSSMGGPVALEAAALMPNRVVAVVAADSLHSTARPDPEAWRQYVESFRLDFATACRSLATSLFHAGTAPELVDEVKTTVCAANPEVARALLGAFGDYDLGRALARVSVPVLALNGDLYPTDEQGNRKIHPGFRAICFPGVGHFPMLERPKEFNRELTRIVESLRKGERAGRE